MADKEQTGRRLGWTKPAQEDNEWVEGLLLHEDDLCVIFRDLRDRAEAHYQCIPKRHIMNYTYLRLEEWRDADDKLELSPDLKLLRHME